MSKRLKILITGPPRCGKTTLVSQISIQLKKMNIKIFGFITTEVKKGQKRIGFRAIDINSKYECWLSRKTNKKTQYMVGSYNVFIGEFEQFLEKSFENFSIDNSNNLIIIDEIGKMELYSKKFISLISEIFKSNNSILATIGQKLRHPVKEMLLQMKNIKIYNLNRNNFNDIKSDLIQNLLEQ